MNMSVGVRVQKVETTQMGVVSEGIAEKLTCVARSQQRADLGQECPREGKRPVQSP